jgi:hypothetical protein
MRIPQLTISFSQKTLELFKWKQLKQLPKDKATSSSSNEDVAKRHFLAFIHSAAD